MLSARALSRTRMVCRDEHLAGSEQESIVSMTPWTGPGYAMGPGRMNDREHSELASQTAAD